jgi:DNA polymerase III delta subunit
MNETEFLEVMQKQGEVLDAVIKKALCWKSMYDVAQAALNKLLTAQPDQIVDILAQSYADIKTAEGK